MYGIEAYVVDVEVNISTGGNGKFFISGLPDAAVRESRSRIIASIRNNGFTFPYQAITVNLAPADVKKEGSAFDLPLADPDARRPNMGREHCRQGQRVLLRASARGRGEPAAAG